MLGAIIKKNRLDQNLSQSSLCKGICAISYLSKIESAQVKANNEIIDMLLERLAIKITSSHEDTHQYKDIIHAFFEHHNYGRFDYSHRNITFYRKKEKTR